MASEEPDDREIARQRKQAMLAEAERLAREKSADNMRRVERLAEVLGVAMESPEHEWQESRLFFGEVSISIDGLEAALRKWGKL